MNEGPGKVAPADLPDTPAPAQATSPEPSELEPSARVLPQGPGLLPAAVSQMQDVKGDVQLLLETAIRLITDDAERTRTEAQKERDELDRWRTRAVEAEKQQAVDSHDLGSLRAARRLGDAMGTLGGVLTGIGASRLRDTPTIEEWLLTLVGLLLIGAAWIFVPRGQK